LADREILAELKKGPRRPQPTSFTVVIKAGESLSDVFELWLCSSKASFVIGHAPQRFDQQREGGRGLAAGRIIEVIARKRRAPVFKHAPQASFIDVGLH
jgi:hypothetical protein